MILSMVQRKIPIDGVGFQMHVKIASPPDEAKVSSNIARIGKLGLKVHITEMDVACPDPCDADAQEQQANVYTSMLRACLANSGVCTSFEVRSLSDLPIKYIAPTYHRPA
jgi:endo-1,4-beta-xylanase